MNNSFSPIPAYDPTVLQKNADTLVRFCAGVKSGEKLLLIFDDSTREIEEYLRKAGEGTGVHMTVEYMGQGGMHGVEPPANVVRAMEQADVILGLTKYSLAHTSARFAATNRGARYLSLPQYGLVQLARPSLAVDFKKWAAKGRKIKEILDNGKTARITTDKGTDLTVSFGGRTANWAPGYCDEPGMLGSPPDIETNVAPLETESEGVLVVDGSIPCEALGLLKGMIRVKVGKGAIVEIEHNEEGKILSGLFEAAPVDPKRKILAEFGIGLNPQAQLCGLMLEDEGCLGTVHFGFGSNATIGGANKTDFHLDMVIRKPTVTIGRILLIKNGDLVI